MSQQPANPIQVEKCLKGMDYPANKNDVINYARQHGADQQVEQTLNRLPNETFNKPTDISKAIGEMDRGQR